MKCGVGGKPVWGQVGCLPCLVGDEACTGVNSSMSHMSHGETCHGERQCCSASMKEVCQDV